MPSAVIPFHFKHVKIKLHLKALLHTISPFGEISDLKLMVFKDLKILYVWVMFCIILGEKEHLTLATDEQ